MSLHKNYAAKICHRRHTVYGFKAKRLGIDAALVHHHCRRHHCQLCVATLHLTAGVAVYAVKLLLYL